jgi:hypothetical protein
MNDNLQNTKTIGHVIIITYCRKPELFYGTSLVFGSIRLGFPNAEIVVIDNGSIPFVLSEIETLCNKVNARFVPIQARPHSLLLQDIIMNEKESLAIIDPDIIFWEQADQLNNDTISGRLIPEFYDPYTGCHTKERLHTSFLKIPDPLLLQSQIRTIKESKFDWNPFQPQMIQEKEKWIRYDTMAVLCNSIPYTPFNEKELSKYDHLFCGSHSDIVQPKLGEWSNLFLDLHKAVAAGDYSKLKGIWKEQNKFFEAMNKKMKETK